MPTKRLNKHTFLTAGDVPGIDQEKFGGPLKNQVETILGPAVDQVSALMKQLRESGKYTEAGLREESRQVGLAAIAEITDKMAKMRGFYEHELKKISAPSRLPTIEELASRTKAEPAVMFHRLAELRQAFFAKITDAVDQRVVLMEAAATNDLELLVAVLGCHPLLQNFGKDRKLAGDVTTAWLHHRLPPEAKAVHEALSLFDSNFATARTIIGELTGAPLSEDVLAKMAAADPEAA